MQFQLKPKTPVPTREAEDKAIIVNGQEIGTLKASHISTLPAMAVIRVPYERAVIIGTGFSSGDPAEALEEAAKDLRQQAEAITTFLQELGQ